MTKCLLKKFIMKKLNDIAKSNSQSIDEVKSKVELWSKRTDLIQEFLKSLLAKIEDHELTVEELQSIPEEFEKLTKEW